MSFNESLICDKLKQLNINFEPRSIMSLGNKDKKELRELI